MRETIFRFSARLFGKHYKKVFLSLFIVVVTISIYLLIFPPKIQSDILSLLPQKDPVVQDFKSALEDFKSIDHLFILVKLKNNEEFIEDYFDIVDEYVEELRKSSLLFSVEYRISDFEPAIKDLSPYLFLYFNESDIANLKKVLSTHSIKSSMAKNRESLSRPTSFFEKHLIKYDPLHILPMLKGHFEGKSRKLNIDLSSGYYLSKDKNNPALLIIARPKEPAQDIVFGRKLFKTLNEIETKIKGKNKEAQNLTFLYGGGYAVNQSDSALVIHDAIYNTLSSFVLVLLITFLSFRSKGALIYGWLPLLLGIFFTLFLLKLFGGTINSATASIGALLIGLGIDFSTLLYGRYVNERKAGESLENSIEKTMVNTFKGVFIGAVTTVATFLCLIIAPFSGMRQIGLLVSVGIILVLVLNLILFPAMVTFHYEHKRKREKKQKLRLYTFKIENIAKLSVKYPVISIAISLLLTCVFLYYAFQITLDDSVSALRSPNNSGLSVTREINSTFGASFTYMMATFYGDSPDEISRKGKIISNVLEPFRLDQRILFTDSLSTYLPSVQEQEKIKQKLIDLQKEGFTFEKIKNDFLSACKENNFDPYFFNDFLSSLNKVLNPEILTYERLMQSPLSTYVDKFLVKKGNLYRGAVYIYISEEFKRSEPVGLVDKIKSVCPDAKVTGINRLSRVVRQKMKESSLRTFILGSILVFLIILLDFKSLKLTILSLSPLCLSLIYLYGSMTILKEPLNMMNIFVTTMIIGIGSDYGIHIVHRFKESSSKEIEKVINEAVRPVIIAALTTIAGFGSLYFSSFPGLKSVGLVALLGTFYSCFSCLTFLMACLSIISKRS